ncbi:M20/M25/M40 family metallo-hydrolase [Algoriphagus kandeliae]|uniref:M20/M25/M40 family metallo-hydrolase n=1 Tax=Algoriphagus kandeliae TaxID=2562278 RepID=A0A4Y9QYY7_9BACT|nr:M28 family peptidase [Algoriphagus kandeliae]TFV97619.1 M20/M25/M40 family metallo-hydrolase [Algoriphagus kandeliae]
MKNICLTLGLVLVLSAPSWAQKKDIEKKFKEKEAIGHFSYLASDELMGRDPVRPEIAMAYNYIADQLKKYGTQPVPGADGYFQNIPFRLSTPPKEGNLTLGDSKFSQGQEMLVLNGDALTGEFDVVDLGFGNPEDFAGKDLKGKVVITNVGAPDRMSPAQLFSAGREKVARAQEAGAIAIIEKFNIPSVPWQLISNFLNRPTLGLDQGESSNLPYLWVKDLENSLAKKISDGAVKTAQLNINGKENRAIEGKNVIGWIEGTDENLKNEYILLSAHYDHVGVGTPDATGDSIYNGARDNAVGTVAVLNAAKYFAKNPPKRSVIFALWTAEEKGLLGSAYFAENPLVPLDKIVFNLNIDNGGYNDTEVITVIGLGRTSSDPLISEAVSEFGLEAIADPAPEQGLYDRSDNVNFARKGIPSPTFSLGFRAFDDEINKYYHKPGDQVDNFDLDYAVKYWKSYILAAELIANDSNKPLWNAGDKYEGVSKELYGLN